jgi:hypothetical protein
MLHEEVQTSVFKMVHWECLRCNKVGITVGEIHFEDHESMHDAAMHVWNLVLEDHRVLNPKCGASTPREIKPLGFSEPKVGIA